MSDDEHDVPAFPMKRCPFSPPPEYAEKRTSDPISRVRMPDGSAAWLVTINKNLPSAGATKR